MVDALRLSPLQNQYIHARRPNKRSASGAAVYPTDGDGKQKSRTGRAWVVLVGRNSKAYCAGLMLVHTSGGLRCAKPPYKLTHRECCVCGMVDALRLSPLQL